MYRITLCDIIARGDPTLQVSLDFSTTRFFGFRISKFEFLRRSRLLGGVLVSTGPADRRSHAEDDRWPRKISVKTITANEEFALAA